MIRVFESQDGGLAHLDTYLAQVHRHLKSLPDAEIGETLAELKSHVLDKVGADRSTASIEAALAGLGSPREVARINVTERIVAQVEQNRSPLSVLRSVVRLAGLSLFGTYVFLVSFLGYGLAAGLLITALVKPFLWDKAGLWISRAPNGDLEGVSLGMTDSALGHEILGAWIIPIGIVVGLVLGWLTWRFGLASLRRMRRRATATR
ncbi:MAG: DUF1700 domain-containing protein [Phenylobacterium sp.]